MKPMWRLLVVSIVGGLFARPFVAVVDGSSVLDRDHPRIYFAEIDDKYSGPMKDIINGRNHMGEVVSAEREIWSTDWLCKLLALCN